MILKGYTRNIAILAFFCFAILVLDFYEFDEYLLWSQIAPSLEGECRCIKLIVLTCNRPASLSRLMDSLYKANYSSVSSSIDLVISIDLPRGSYFHDERTINFVEELEWHYGTKTVIKHSSHQGNVLVRMRLVSPYHE